MALTAEQYRLQQQIAINSRWAREDPTENAERGQRGLVAKFEREAREADPGASDAEIARRAEFWAARAQHVADAVQAVTPPRISPDEQAFQRAQLAADDRARAGRAVLQRARAQAPGRRGGGPSFRSTAATAPAHLPDAGCCLYSTDDQMAHDQCWPSQPYADQARSSAVLAEFANHGASRSRTAKVSYR